MQIQKTGVHFGDVVHLSISLSSDGSFFKNCSPRLAATHTPERPSPRCCPTSTPLNPMCRTAREHTMLRTSAIPAARVLNRKASGAMAKRLQTLTISSRIPMFAENSDASPRCVLNSSIKSPLPRILSSYGPSERFALRLPLLVKSSRLPSVTPSAMNWR